jgi:hypothetical protein
VGSYSGLPVGAARLNIIKSFLLLFFKKEVLPLHYQTDINAGALPNPAP